MADLGFAVRSEDHLLPFLILKAALHLWQVERVLLKDLEKGPPRRRE